MAGGELRPSWAIALVLVLVLLVLVIANWDDLVHSLLFEPKYASTARVVGVISVHRFTGASSERVVAWHVSSGFLAWERGEGHLVEYDADGRVEKQFCSSADPEERFDPPWLYGVEDLSAPTAPWLAEGKTFEEWWSEIPDGRKER